MFDLFRFAIFMSKLFGLMPLLVEINLVMYFSVFGITMCGYYAFIFVLTFFGWFMPLWLMVLVS